MLTAGTGGLGGDAEFKGDVKFLFLDTFFEGVGHLGSEAEQEGDTGFAFNHRVRNDDARVDQGFGFYPVFRASEDPFITHIECFVTGQQTDGVRDIAVVPGYKLELIVLGAHGVFPTNPVERLVADLVGMLVEINDEALQLRLVEKSIEQTAVLDVVES